jgi:peptidoglycan biosynthesis protein MviN/MurJ (putative lipid II flippase)
MQGYFANRKMISVTVIGVVFSLLSVVVSYVAIRVCGADGLWALAAVALGYTLARTLKTVTLVAVLQRSVPLLPPRETLAFLGRLAALSVLCGEAAWLSLHLTSRLPLPGSGKVELLAVLAIVGLVTLAAFAAGAKALHVQEPWTMAAWGWEKVRRKLRR